MNDQITNFVVATCGPALAGWVISVERRLSKLANIKETVDKTDSNVQMLTNHLLNTK